MASISPSPNSTPTAVPPNSTTSSPPPPAPSTSSPPPLDDSTTSPAPTTSQPNATSDPPPPTSPTNSSSSPTDSPPPAVPSAPPPVSLSSPPPTPVLPPPESPATPPPLPPPPNFTPQRNSPPPPTSTPQRNPPPPTSTPLHDPPPSPPPLPPPPNSTPQRNPPPPPTSTPVHDPPPSPSPPAPVVPSAPPPEVSPPSPNGSPPPVSPSRPVTTSPPPQTFSPPPPLPAVSNPPPATSSPPLPSSSPPPPSANPPRRSPDPPRLSPPPSTISQPTSPPPTDSPPATSLPPVNQTHPTPSSPSPPLPPPSLTPTVPPQNNQSTGGLVDPALPAPTQPNSGNTPNSGGTNTGGAVTIGIVVGIVVLSFIGMAVWLLRKRKRKVTGYHPGHVTPSPFGSSPASDTTHTTKVYSSAPLIGCGSGSDFIYSPPESGVLGNSRSRFTYEELVEATNEFSVQNLLGEGGFGCVYKGILADGREVAVKQLKIGGSQGEREFSAEVETISRVHHRHLVSLVGYCISDHQRLLVYDYVPNNTLYYHLHGEGRPVMNWETRVKVATGAARGISYLHEDCHPRIIHRDIKSSNILLDNNFDAQVSDFGLAKLALDAYTHITTRVMGTFGYMAPEYASSGKLTEKSDVYSFGVVLLELITGRKPVDASQPLGEESLVEWARPLMSDALHSTELEGLIDPRLENNYVQTEMIRMIEAAAACVRHSAVKRPGMGQVMRALNCIGDPSSDLTNGMRPGQSEIFNSAQQSAEIRMFRRMAFGIQDYNSDIFSRNSWGS